MFIFILLAIGLMGVFVTLIRKNHNNFYSKYKRYDPSTLDSLRKNVKSRFIILIVIIVVTPFLFSIAKFFGFNFSGEIVASLIIIISVCVFIGLFYYYTIRQVIKEIMKSNS